MFYRANLAKDRGAASIAVRGGLDEAIDEVAAAGSPKRAFLTRSWFDAALSSNAAQARTIVMRRECGEAALALPVAPGAMGINAVPGSYWPFRSFPIAADLTAEELAAVLAARSVKRTLGHVWRLGPIYSNDPALELIDQAARSAGWRVIKRRLATSYQVDFAEAEARGPWPRNSTLRRNRQLENQMARIGALEWHSLSGRQIDRGLLDLLGRLEAASWHGKSNDAKFLSPTHRRVWDRLIADPGQAERLRVHLLTVDGKAAVMLFQLECGSTIHGIATSYDPVFATHSPGKCLHMRALVAARAQGVERFDWGAGDSGYKRLLSARPGPQVVDCLLIRGALPMMAKPALERLWRRHESAGAVLSETDGVALDGID